MANAVATPTVTLIDATQDCVHVFGTLAVSASPAVYVAGGITMSLTGLVPGVNLPIAVYVQSAQPAATANTGAYLYQFAKGTTLANGKLQIFDDAGSAGAFAELAASAIPAGVSGDVIQFEAWFKKGGV